MSFMPGRGVSGRYSSEGFDDNGAASHRNGNFIAWLHSQLVAFLCSQANLPFAADGCDSPEPHGGF